MKTESSTITINQLRLQPVELKASIIESATAKQHLIMDDFRQRIHDILATDGSVIGNEYDNHQQSFKSESIILSGDIPTNDFLQFRRLKDLDPPTFDRNDPFLLKL